MDNPRHKPASTPRERVLWSTIVFVVALAVRTLHLIQLKAAPFFPFRIGDGETYHAWAREIAAGDWIGHGVFYQAPLYPYFLGSIYSLFGDDVMTVRKCQAFIGAFSCLLIANAAWNLFSKRTGIVAGFMLAFYAPAIYFDGLIQKSVLDLFFLCLALWLMSLVGIRPSRWQMLWLGMTLGMLILTRENALILVPVLLIWIAFYRIESQGRWWAELQRRSFASFVFALGLAIVLLPVAVRNKVVGGEFHLTTSQLGTNFFIGNNPKADGLYRPLRFGRGHARYERNDATEIAEAAMGRELTPGEVSDYYLNQSRDYILSQPGHWLRLLSWKFALTWNAVEITDSEDQYTYAEWSLPLRVSGSLCHFGVLVPLALLGVWSTWSQRHNLWIFYLMVLAFMIGVVGFFVFARYRFPLVPVLILFAAAGVTDWWWYRRKTSRAKLAACVTSLIAVAVFCNWSLLDTASMQATTHSNTGNQLAVHGQFDEAVLEYERALRLDADHALAHNNLAAVQMRRGEIHDAIAHLERALSIKPDYPTAHQNLNKARRQLGR